MDKGRRDFILGLLASVVLPIPDKVLALEKPFVKQFCFGATTLCLESVQAGNLIACWVQTSGDIDINVTDDRGNFWTRLCQEGNEQVWYLNNADAGPISITASNAKEFCAVEIKTS